MPPESLQTMHARADLCRFLAACYYQPGPEFSEERMFDSMRDAAAKVDPAVAAGAIGLGEAFTSAELDALLLDYARLFLGPTDVVARPYGSTWLDGERTLMGDSTVAVRALYREGGFDIDEAFRELPDHIAVELEFLYVLLFREAQAHADGDGAAADAARSLKQRFLAEHLGAWIGPFTSAIAGGAQTDFFRRLAALTRRFVDTEVAAAPVRKG